MLACVEYNSSRTPGERNATKCPESYARIALTKTKFERSFARWLKEKQRQWLYYRMAMACLVLWQVYKIESRAKAVSAALWPPYEPETGGPPQRRETRVRPIYNLTDRGNG